MGLLAKTFGHIDDLGLQSVSAQYMQWGHYLLSSDDAVA